MICRKEFFISVFFFNKLHLQLHHPISKPQLEEVWEKQDHMDIQDFNPKTFFHLHGMNAYMNKNK